VHDGIQELFLKKPKPQQHNILLEYLLRIAFYVMACLLIIELLVLFSITFHVQSMGGCNRCQMVNLYQNSGQVVKSKEPLATLASYRRQKVG
jgi:hypothetical protein